MRCAWAGPDGEDFGHRWRHGPQSNGGQADILMPLRNSETGAGVNALAVTEPGRAPVSLWSPVLWRFCAHLRHAICIYSDFLLCAY